MSNQNKFITLKFEAEQATIPEMEPLPEDFHLGAKADIDSKNIQVRVAEFPDIFNYYHLLKKSEAEIPQELQELVSRFDLYLITHSVGIVDKNDTGSVAQLGLKLTTLNGLRLQNRALLPETAFIKPAISGGFTFDASLKASGQMEIPGTNKLLKQLPIKLSTAATAKASLDSDLSIKLSLPTLAPVIQTIGQYSSYAEWCLNFNEKPLVGDQLFIQFVAVEKGTEEINFEATVYVTIKTFGIFKSRRESVPATIAIPCPLRAVAETN
ncbi:MAG TPA: hypothetical protein VF487_18375 [Chitinophagaceae bacterium]